MCKLYDLIISSASEGSPSRVKTLDPFQVFYSPENLLRLQKENFNEKDITNYLLSSCCLSSVS